MVTIVDYAKRQNAEGEEFFVLILQGGVELVQSQETGNYYATARKASITSTFPEEFCKGLVGKQLPGSVKRISCDPFDYKIKETGESISLSHHWAYQPEGDALDELVHKEEPDEFSESLRKLAAAGV